MSIIYYCDICSIPCITHTNNISPNQCIRNDLDVSKKANWKPGLLQNNTLHSVKPDQPTHSCTPCLADTQDSRHSGAKDGEVLNECDPEGMKPKSKYEKAFRDVK